MIFIEVFVIIIYLIMITNTKVTRLWSAKIISHENLWKANPQKLCSSKIIIVTPFMQVNIDWLIVNGVIITVLTLSFPGFYYCKFLQIFCIHQSISCNLSVPMYVHVYGVGECILIVAVQRGNTACAWHFRTWHVLITITINFYLYNCSHCYCVRFFILSLLLAQGLLSWHIISCRIQLASLLHYISCIPLPWQWTAYWWVIYPMQGRVHILFPVIFIRVPKNVSCINWNAKENRKHLRSVLNFAEIA